MTTSTRPLLVAITSELPWPLNSGGHLRTFHMMRALAQRFDLTLLAPVTRNADEDLEHLFDAGIPARAIPVPGRSPLREWRRVAAAMLAGEPYVMYRRHDHAPMHRALRDFCAQVRPHAAYLDHLDSFVYRRSLPAGVPIVGDMHNVYSTLAERAASQYSGGSAWLMRRDARLLRLMEQRAAAAAGALLTVSAEEQTVFRSRGGQNVRLVPNGVDCAAFAHLPAGRPADTAEILFLGTLSWRPNAEAATFLAREVLPAVRRIRPDARLSIVGRTPGPDVVALGELEGVEIAADVPDVAPYFARASALAVPLSAGGGTRLKILEAFAAGLPVVSTSIGCEGIEAVHHTHLDIVERERFAQGLALALAESDRLRSQAERARELARQQYDWASIGAAAADAVEAVAEGAPVKD